MDLANILAGIRYTESGSFAGDYAKRGQKVNGDEPYGAYGILRRNWDPFTRLSGILGAPIESPEAQDIVAATIMQVFFQRYADWTLANMAWFAGPQQAGKVLQRGYAGLESIQNTVIRQWVGDVMNSAQTSMRPENARYLKRIPQSVLQLQTPGSSWLMPVAGQAEWSRGSWMPNTKNHRGRTHGAIDVYAERGTPIVAPVPGKVISVKEGKLGGHTAKILGDDGVEYYFAHMAEQSQLKRGQRVNAGWLVGYVGNSGSARTTSPHLHFSMRKDGKVVNPSSFLEQGGHMGLAPNWQEEALTTEHATDSPWSRSLHRISETIAQGAPEPLPPLEAPMTGAMSDPSEIQGQEML